MAGSAYSHYCCLVDTAHGFLENFSVLCWQLPFLSGPFPTPFFCLSPLFPLLVSLPMPFLLMPGDQILCRVVERSSHVRVLGL